MELHEATERIRPELVDKKYVIFHLDNGTSLLRNFNEFGI